MNGVHPIPDSEIGEGQITGSSPIPPAQLRWPPDRETQEVFLRLLRENSTFGSSEGVGGGGGKTATFIVGPASNTDSSTYDYKTDGTADEVEIQAAIDALPSTGGEILFREGTYSISASITWNKSSMTFQGMGASTIFKLANSANTEMI